jgi:hypothetical protein
MKHKLAFLLPFVIATIIFEPVAASDSGSDGLDISVKNRIDSLLASFPQDGAGGVVAVLDGAFPVPWMPATA